MIFLTTLIQIILLLAFAWAALVTLVGLLRGEKNSNTIAKPSRFAIVICAHNEESVIQKLLDSLSNLDYPKNCYQVFLLADHCDDGTVDIGEKNDGVIVYARDEGPRSGKGAVLAWGLNRIKESFGDHFDQVVVFDADNIVDKDFLTKMNESFKAGAKLVMGNRLALNPYASTISGWYTLYWQTVDILYCKPRSNLGLSAILSGTGFGFSWDLIKDTGWQTTTITEDIEFSMQQNLKGIFAVYQEEASFYDEQPTDMKTLISQLRRWCTGNYQIFAVYKKLWWKTFKGHPTMKLLDNIIPIGLCCTFGLYLILSFSWLFYNAVRDINPFGWIDVLWWGGLYVISVLVSLWSTLKGKFSLHKMLPSILTSGIYCIIFSLVAVYSLFYPVTVWKPIKHSGKTGK